MGLIRTVLSFGFKPAVDVKSWIGYDYLKDNTKSLFVWTKGLVVPKKTRHRRNENFEQAVSRMHLTEKDLDGKAQALIRHAYLFISMAFFFFVYAFYLIFKANIVAGLLTLVLAAYLVVKAYLSHFWHFEIKNRKLGCSFKEWFRGHINK